MDPNSEFYIKFGRVPEDLLSLHDNPDEPYYYAIESHGNGNVTIHELGDDGHKFCIDTESFNDLLNMMDMLKNCGYTEQYRDFEED